MFLTDYNLRNKIEKNFYFIDKYSQPILKQNEFEYTIMGRYGRR